MYILIQKEWETGNNMYKSILTTFQPKDFPNEAMIKTYLENNHLCENLGLENILNVLQHKKCTVINILSNTVKDEIIYTIIYKEQL